jgi:ABC-type branched-subunit amino acid transport system permease subunit
MEGPLNHVFHGAVISAILYFLMSKVLRQSENVAVTRSVFLGLLASLYMLLFGHGLPNNVNSALKFF